MLGCVVEIKIGKRFPGNFLPKTDGPVLDFTKDRLNLIVQLSGVSADEVQTFNSSNQFRFGLYLTRAVAFLLLEVKGLLEWSDAPYSISTVPAQEWPDSSRWSEVKSLTLNVILVERKRSVVLGVREFTLDPAFSRELLQHVESMKAAPLSASEYLDTIAMIQKHHQPEAMVKEASVLI